MITYLQGFDTSRVTNETLTGKNLHDRSVGNHILVQLTSDTVFYMHKFKFKI